MDRWRPCSIRSQRQPPRHGLDRQRVEQGAGRVVAFRHAHAPGGRRRAPRRATNQTATCRAGAGRNTARRHRPGAAASARSPGVAAIAPRCLDGPGCVRARTAGCTAPRLSAAGGSRANVLRTVAMRRTPRRRAPPRPAARTPACAPSRRRPEMPRPARQQRVQRVVVGPATRVGRQLPGTDDVAQALFAVGVLQLARPAQALGFGRARRQRRAEAACQAGDAGAIKQGERLPAPAVRPQGAHRGRHVVGQGRCDRERMLVNLAVRCPRQAGVEPRQPAAQVHQQQDHHAGREQPQGRIH